MVCWELLSESWVKTYSATGERDVAHTVILNLLIVILNLTDFDHISMHDEAHTVLASDTSTIIECDCTR